jgi:hypothetical protein
MKPIGMTINKVKATYCSSGIRRTRRGRKSYYRACKRGHKNLIKYQALSGYLDDPIPKARKVRIGKSRLRYELLLQKGKPEVLEMYRGDLAKKLGHIVVSNRISDPIKSAVASGRLRSISYFSKEEVYSLHKSYRLN